MGILSSIFGSQTKTTKQPYENNPWAPQQEYLKEGFSSASDALTNALGYLNQSGGTGVAGLTADQQRLIQNGMNVGTQTQGLGSGMMGMGAQQMGNLYGAQNALGGLDQYAQQMAGTAQKYSGGMNAIAGQSSQTGQQFGQVGQAAGQFGQQAAQQMMGMAGNNQQAGVQGANQFGQQAQGISGLSGQYSAQIGNQLDQSKAASQGVLSSANGLVGNGGVGDIISQAGQVADNPYLQSQIDAAVGDVQRGFEKTQSQINANASGAGGMNSTRAALMESQALDNAQRNASNISTQMRSDAYNTGLSTALENKSQNNSLLNTQLSAGQQQLGINDQRISLAGQDLSTRLNANSQYGTAQQMASDARNTGFNQYSTGVQTQQAGYDQQMAGMSGQLSAQGQAGNLLGASGQMTLGAQQNALAGMQANNQQRQSLGQFGYDMATGGANLATSGAQNALDYASVIQNQNQSALNGGMNNGLNLVNQYMQAIGGNYGSQGYNTTTSQSPSIFQQVVGGTAAVLGGMKSLG